MNQFHQPTIFSKSPCLKNQNNFNLFNLGTGKSDLNNVEFFLPVNDHGQATMSPHSSDSWKNQEIKKVYCNVICLDNFEPIESLEHIHFIKIDVEGAELPSLIGAKRLLAMHKPILFFEGCMQWMKSFQYSPQDFDQFPCCQSLQRNQFGW